MKFRHLIAKLQTFCIIFFILTILLSGCAENYLAGKKVTIDPGHGGTAQTDSFRVGPSGEREEWINLRVALHLQQLLEDAGCRVLITRENDQSVSLRDRAKLAVDNKCDAFISIHHNATADSMVNFPIVYFHGNASENQAGVLLGRMVIQRLSEVLHEDQTNKSLVSDLTIFPGSGTAVLRHSYGIPGIIGEASFFTNPPEELKLKQPVYNQKEAEAYFLALDDFFAYTRPAIKKNFSQIRIPPFFVLQEAERMDPVALLWKKDYQYGQQLSHYSNIDSLQKALDFLERSIRSFPDSWLAGKSHALRAAILKQLSRTDEAEIARQRVKEHYIDITVSP